MNIRIHDHPPATRRPTGLLAHYLDVDVDVYGNPRFYHQATAGRLRRAYRTLRQRGIDAATARTTIHTTMFAVLMASNMPQYHTDRSVEQVAS